MAHTVRDKESIVIRYTEPCMAHSRYFLSTTAETNNSLENDTETRNKEK